MVKSKNLTLFVNMYDKLFPGSCAIFSHVYNRCTIRMVTQSLGHMDTVTISIATQSDLSGFDLVL